MNAGPCGKCKHGHPTGPGGQRTSSGTVWCAKRTVQMGRSRQMPCFVPLAGGASSRQCHACKWAKFIKPQGGTPEPGSVWCDKRHFEINKLRKVECFEPR
ncbi:MAG: hypothetical protein P8Y85_05755 [Nitrospirota bacterium]|jgi:hypothetical protein